MTSDLRAPEGREWRAAAPPNRLTALADRLWRAAYRAAYWGLRLYWWVCFVRTSGVYVAVWVGDEVLLIRNSYRSYLSMPGGGVARGEERAVAGARELEEEVGVPVDARDLVHCGDFMPVVHHQRDDASVYELRLREVPEITVDRREVVWAGLRTPTAALAEELAPVVRLYLEAYVSS